MSWNLYLVPSIYSNEDSEEGGNYEVPLLSPFPPRIPPELIDDPHFHDKIHLELNTSTVARVSGLIVFTAWVVLSNVLVLVGITKKAKGKKHATDVYLVNLCVTDILVGVLVLPMMGAVIVIGYFPFGAILCNWWIFWDYFLIVLASYSSTALIMNYFWMIRFPLHYNESRRAHIGIVVLLWLLVNASWAPPFLHNIFTVDYPLGVCGYGVNPNRYYTLYVGVTGFYIPLLISVLSLPYSVRLLRKGLAGRLFYKRTQSKSISFQSYSVKNLDYVRRVWSPRVVAETSCVILSQERARKDLPLVISMFSVFAASRALFYVYFGVGAFLPKAFPPDLSNGVFWIMHSNSALSPILHVLLDSDLREGIRQIFQKNRRLEPLPSAGGNTDHVLPSTIFFEELYRQPQNFFVEMKRNY